MGYGHPRTKMGNPSLVGTFNISEETTIAYNKVAIEFHGPRAKLNFPFPDNSSRMTKKTEQLEQELVVATK